MADRIADIMFAAFGLNLPLPGRASTAAGLAIARAPVGKTMSRAIS
jgi:hypothetical protein